MIQLSQVFFLKSFLSASGSAIMLVWSVVDLTVVLVRFRPDNAKPISPLRCGLRDGDKEPQSNGRLQKLQSATTLLHKAKKISRWVGFCHTKFADSLRKSSSHLFARRCLFFFSS